MPGVGGYPGPVFGLSVGVDQDSQAPETTGQPGGTSSMNQQCLAEGALNLLTYNCQPSASLCQPGGPVRGAGRGRSAGRRFVQARRCLPSPAMDALRPPMPVLPLSSDAHRATRRGFGWPPGSSDAYSELFNSPRSALTPYSDRRFGCAVCIPNAFTGCAVCIPNVFTGPSDVAAQGRRPDRFCAAVTGVPSSGSSADALLPVLENADRSTSFAQKFFPSIGTIMICNLSDSRSAMIFWISIGFDFSTAASNFMRSASAAAVTPIRFASASERFFCRSSSAFLSMIFAFAAASAFCNVACLRACASNLLCSICFFFIR